MSKLEIFVSSEGTKYKWEREKETIITLSDTEVEMVKLRTRLMNDAEIQNTTSGNGIAMGIPIVLNNNRMQDIKETLVSILKKKVFIDFEDHAIARIVEDSLLAAGDPKKRGWVSQQDAKDCVMSARKVEGLRLNVDHRHPENTETEKYLFPHIALTISGQKAGGKGRLVLVILTEKAISIVTVL